VNQRLKAGRAGLLPFAVRGGCHTSTSATTCAARSSLGGRQPWGPTNISSSPEAPPVTRASLPSRRSSGASAGSVRLTRKRSSTPVKTAAIGWFWSSRAMRGPLGYTSRVGQRLSREGTGGSFGGPGRRTARCGVPGRRTRNLTRWDRIARLEATMRWWRGDGVQDGECT
jgi:hypothetical protein